MDAKELKTALVTGAGMGIGLACAEAFARAGYLPDASANRRE